VGWIDQATGIDELGSIQCSATTVTLVSTSILYATVSEGWRWLDGPILHYSGSTDKFPRRIDPLETSNTESVYEACE